MAWNVHVGAHWEPLQYSMVVRALHGVLATAFYLEIRDAGLQYL